METFTKDQLYIDDIVVYLNTSMSCATFKYIGQIIGFADEKVIIKQLSKANQFVTPNECVDYGEVSVYPNDVVHVIISRFRNKSPKCSVGDIVWYTYYRKEPERCKVSMLQQKADKSWKVRLTPEGGGVFDVTLDNFNKYCFYTISEAEKNIDK